MVSVIVPVYNAEKYLRECLDSLGAQTYSPLEIILVDDGSTDSSGKICGEYAKKYENIAVIHQNNTGVSAARNIALKVAKGNYIAFCDSDDIVAPDMIEVLLKNMAEMGADLSCCSFIKFNDEKGRMFNYGQGIYELKEDAMFMTILKNENCAGYLWNKLFCRNLLIADKPILFRTEIAILEDEVFVLEYLERCNKICVTDGQLYGYRNNPDGALRQKLSTKVMTSVIGREKIFEIIRRSVKNEEVKSVAWNQLVISYVILYKKLLHTDIENRVYWKNKILQGFRRNKGLFALDSNCSFKERCYYFILCLVVSRIK